MLSTCHTRSTVLFPTRSLCRDKAHGIAHGCLGTHGALPHAARPSQMSAHARADPSASSGSTSSRTRLRDSGPNDYDGRKTHQCRRVVKAPGRVAWGACTGTRKNCRPPGRVALGALDGTQANCRRMPKAPGRVARRAPIGNPKNAGNSLRPPEGSPRVSFIGDQKNQNRP